MIDLPRQMICEYVVRRRKDLINLQSLAQIDKIEEINTIGHQIAGNARSFGFEPLEEIARELESLKLDESTWKLELIISRYSQWLEKAELEFLS